MKSSSAMMKMWVAALWCAVSVGCWAGDAANQSQAKTVSAQSEEGLLNLPKLPNRGFMKNPPEELKQKFPMCDEFLDIQWISKEKRIGFVQHDMYKDGKPAGRTRSLVYIQDTFAQDRLDLYSFDKNGELDKLFDAIKNSNVANTIQPIVKYNGYEASLLINYATWIYTYADHRENICIPYPNNDRMWIVEFKQVGKIYNDEKIDEAVERLSKNFPGIMKKYLIDRGFSDINHDRTDDYLANGSYIYSTIAGYGAVERFSVDVNGVHGVFTFGIKSTNRSCKINGNGNIFITTDGYNYFMSNQCNLTELTK